ncbi:MAG: hypothetical protein HUJ54_10855 [Erysipelotrichaceae bacterium]|nr:hypothetical protein [Erysipelotrichaceae bacterium]
MDQLEVLDQISELEREIALLPPGSLSVKKIKGREYYYHRYTVNGKRREEYADEARAEELRPQIERRKKLEGELKKLKRYNPGRPAASGKNGSREFRTLVRIGEELKNWAEPVRNFKHRECYQNLHQYVFGPHSDRVFVLYGLRRTGKTTMIRQIILDLAPSQRKKTALIQIRSTDTLSALNSDLKDLERNG